MFQPVFLVYESSVCKYLKKIGCIPDIDCSMQTFYVVLHFQKEKNSIYNRIIILVHITVFYEIFYKVPLL